MQYSATEAIRGNSTANKAFPAHPNNIITATVKTLWLFNSNDFDGLFCQMYAGMLGYRCRKYKDNSRSHRNSGSNSRVFTTTTLCLNKKGHPLYFCDNFPNCKPIQIIFGRNVAEKIWNKLTHGNFDIYSSCIASLHRKMTPIFLLIP